MKSYLLPSYYKIYCHLCQGNRASLNVFLFLCKVAQFENSRFEIMIIFVFLQAPIALSSGDSKDTEDNKFLYYDVDEHKWKKLGKLTPSHILRRFSWQRDVCLQLVESIRSQSFGVST